MCEEGRVSHRSLASRSQEKIVPCLAPIEFGDPRIARSALLHWENREYGYTEWWTSTEEYTVNRIIIWIVLRRRWAIWQLRWRWLPFQSWYSQVWDRRVKANVIIRNYRWIVCKPQWTQCGREVFPETLMARRLLYRWSLVFQDNKGNAAGGTWGPGPATAAGARSRRTTLSHATAFPSYKPPCLRMKWI